MLGKKIKVVIGNEDEKGIESAETDKVAGEAILDVVKLDNETPRVGDTITATAYDSDGNDISGSVTWQWYRTTKATGFQNPISNATKQSYTISSMDTGGTVYAWATDNYGKTLMSNEAEPVEGTYVTVITIENISGKQSFSRINDVPVEGDELAVTMDAPGAEKTATYQWFRDGSKITGATASTYTLAEKDTETEISCLISLNAASGYEFEGSNTHLLTSNGILSDGAGHAVSKGDTDAYVTLTTTTHDISGSELKLDIAAPTTGETVNASLKYDVNGDGDEDDLGDWLDTDYVDYAWYLDEVSAAGYLIDGTAYEVKNQDAGHKLICVATGKGYDTKAADAADAWYYGSVQVSTDTITKKLKSVTLDASEVVGDSTSDAAIKNNTGGAGNDAIIDAGDTPTVTGIIGTQITATVKDGANKTVSSGIHATWTRIKDGTSDKINNETGLTYQLKAADANILAMGDGTANTVKATSSVAYKISVTADGYAGSVDATVVIIGSADTTSKTPLTSTALGKGATVQKVWVEDSNGNEVTKDDEAQPVNAGAGEKLTVKTLPAAAANDVNWKWILGTDDAITNSGTGTSFTVPKSTGVGNFITVGGDWKTEKAVNWTDDGTVLSGMIAGLDYGPTTAAAPEASDLVTGQAVATELTVGNLTVTYNTKKDGSGTALQTPEVGSYMIVRPENNPGVEYDFSYTTSRTYNAGVEATSEEGVYLIMAQAVGQKVKVEVYPSAATDGYKEEVKSSFTSETVVPSSRTIKDMKVVEYKGTTRGTNTDAGWYDDDGVDAFKSAKITKTMDATKEYAIIALDSNGDLVTLGAEAVLLDDDNQIDHATFTRTNKNRAKNSLTMTDDNDANPATDNTDADLEIAAGQRITVLIVPNGVDFVGSELEYVFSTAVQ